MNYQLKKQLYQYFSAYENPTDQEKEFVRQITESLEWFDMPGINRNDLKSYGYNISEIPDNVIEDITDRLDSAWRENTLYIDLPIIADAVDAPKRSTAKCPECLKDKMVFNIESMRLECLHCGKEIDVSEDNLYVLVEFPDDTSYFQEKSIGYPSYESQDNRARYVLYNDYVEHFKKEPQDNQYYKPVRYPESQKFMDDPKFDGYSEAIEEQKGVDDFGCAAYWIPVCYL